VQNEQSGVRVAKPIALLPFISVNQRSLAVAQLKPSNLENGGGEPPNPPGGKLPGAWVVVSPARSYDRGEPFSASDSKPTQPALVVVPHVTMSSGLVVVW
jgi:hypothetical protein